MNNRSQTFLLAFVFTMIAVGSTAIRAQMPVPNAGAQEPAEVAPATPEACDPVVAELLKSSYTKVAGVNHYPNRWQRIRALEKISKVAQKFGVTLPENLGKTSYGKGYYDQQIKQAQQEVQQASSILKGSNHKWAAQILDAAVLDLNVVLTAN